MPGRRQRKAPLVVLDYARLLGLWESDLSNPEVMEALGTTRRGIEQAKADLRLPHRSAWRPNRPARKRRRYERRGDGAEITPEEVRHRIAKVQARWTDEVFAMRAKGQFRHVPFTYETYSMRMAVLRR